MATGLSLPGDGLSLVGDLGPTGATGATGPNSITINTTTTSGGATGRVLYDTGTVVGELTTTGQGTTLALNNNPVFTGSTAGSSMMRLQDNLGVTFIQMQWNAGSSGSMGEIRFPTNITGVTARAPFTIIASQGYFNGLIDPTMTWGYNQGVGGVLITATEPGLAWTVEGDYNDGATGATGNKMETYVAYSPTGGGQTRPLFFQFNRDTNRLVTSTIEGNPLNVNDDLGVSAATIQPGQLKVFATTGVDTNLIIGATAGHGSNLNLGIVGNDLYYVIGAGTTGTASHTLGGVGIFSIWNNPAGGGAGAAMSIGVADNNAVLTVANSGFAAVLGLVVRGKSGQSGDLFNIQDSSSNVKVFSLAAGTFGLTNAINLGWTSSATASGALDVLLGRNAAASLRLGAADVDTAPVAQILGVQGSLTGGTINIAGATFTIQSSAGKGSALGGGFDFQTTRVGASGTIRNTFVSAFTVSGAGAAAVSTTGATAMAVGPSGATNPVFTIDASTASQASGIKITGGASGGTAAIAVIDTGTNTPLTIDAKGSGVVALAGTSTGNVTSGAAMVITSAGATSLAVGPSGSTNPAFTVDSSTASAKSGIKFTAGVSGGTAAMAVIDAGTNTNLTIDGKGSGTITLAGTSTGSVKMGAATVVTSAGATALAVGAGGTTNPVFSLDASTASQANGIKFTGGISGGTAAMVVIDSGTNTNLTIDGKGSGQVVINATATGVTKVGNGLTVVGTFQQTSGAFQNITAAGGPTTYTATFSPAVTAYTQGAVYFIQCNSSNAGTAPTININGLGAKTVVKRASTALAAADWLTGAVGIFYYDSTNLQLLNPVVN